MHAAARTNLIALPLKAIIPPANIHDSRVFNNILWHMNEYSYVAMRF